jgi:hypothetical protein
MTVVLKLKHEQTDRCTWLPSMYSLGAHYANNSQYEDYVNHAAAFMLPSTSQNASKTTKRDTNIQFSGQLCQYNTTKYNK